MIIMMVMVMARVQLSVMPVSDASVHVATLSAPIASLSAADSESRAAGRPPTGPGLYHWHESPAPLKPQSLIS